ncbi:hypothetical protein ACIA8H_12895 [Streptomyces goshikiensis]|uniref:hypothetical protein n=1 Tax=Streptomyces goshikiensis TaxID=1942 RepID=UPI0037A3BFDF
MDNDPVIFTSTMNPAAPALLRYPAEADPGLIIREFPAGTFSWSDRYGCPTFDSGRVTEVVRALHKSFSYVQLKQGKSEAEIEYSNRVKRS